MFKYLSGWRLLRFSVALVCLLAVAGCANAPKNIPASDIRIQIEEPDRIRFSGRGAGAGMMLSGSMGSMGIAIGVAIDEGIGKDIHQAALASGFDMRTLVESRLRYLLNARAHASDITLYHVTIHRYGFKGGGETVGIDLDMSMNCDGKALRRISYDSPNSLQEEQITLSFDQVRRDGQRVIESLSTALDDMFAACYVDSSPP